MLVKPENVLRSDRSAWIILAISVVMTSLAWSVSKSYLQRDAADRFDSAIQLARHNIEQRMMAYQSILRAGAGLFDSSETVTREEWKTFVGGIQLDRIYPGIQGLGYCVMLTAEQKSALEQQIRREGYTDFSVHPPGPRDLYSAIIYLEPFDWRNQRAFGYDMFSEPVRREAMERARDSGQIALSGPVILRQETDKEVQQGVLLYQPIYRHGQATATLEQRRAALVAFVYSPFRMGDLMGGILGPGLSLIDFELFDGGQTNDQTLLYRSSAVLDAHAAVDANPQDSRHPQFVTDVPLNIGGRRWTARFSSSPHFEQLVSSIQPTLIASGGLFADFLLFATLMAAFRNRRELARERGRFVLAVESAPVAMIMIDSQNRIMLANHAAENLFGYLDSELVGATIDRLIPMVSGEIQNAFFDPGSVDEQSHRIGGGKDIIGLRKDDTKVALEIGLSFVNGAASCYAIAAISDITERKKHLEALAERELRYRSVIETSPDGFWMLNQNGRLISVNSSYCEMSGYSQPELLSMGIADLEAIEIGEETAMHLEKIHLQGYDRFETLHRRKDGSQWPAEVTVSLMPSRQEIVVFIRDLTEFKALEAERQKAEDAIRELAFYDPLTKLPNRRLLADRIKQTMIAARRHSRHSALLFIDMDNFKALNDSLGHDYGDMLLVEVARRLKACVRQEDTVARLGGDEFVIVLTSLAEDADASIAQVRQVGGKILESLNEAYQLQQHRYYSTPSIGATLFLDDSEPMEAIFKRADSAMYQVKAAGRNAIRLFQAD